MAVDEKKLESDPAVFRYVQRPKPTVARDGEPNKDVESLKESHIPTSKRPEPSQAEGSQQPSRIAVVPRSKRRGLLGALTLVPEVERPQNYENRTKWLITLVVALAGAAAPLGSAVFFRECLLSTLGSFT
jgi:hypothetical protein